MTIAHAMTFRRSKRTPKQRRLRCEPLENRLVMSVTIAWPSREFTANDDGFTISKNNEQQEYQALANDWDSVWYWEIDSEREPLRITSVTSAEHGSVGISEDGKSVLYTPSTGFTGIDRFSYTVTNADGDRDEADVFFNVTDPIFAMRDWFRVDEGSETTELDVLKNDSQNVSTGFNDRLLYLGPGVTDEGDPPFQIVAVGPTSHGGTAQISQDGQRILYAPNGEFEGLESFTYTIENEEGFQTEATVSVQVTTIDDDNPHQAWKEQVEQRFFEAAVERSGYQFGSFASTVYPGFYGISLSPFNITFSTRVTTGMANFDVNDSLNDADYSQTNVQVDGVDEGDVVKTDGNYLYILSDWIDEDSESIQHQLIIVNVQDPSNPTVVSRYGFEGDVIEQYLNGDRLTVISQSDSQLLVTVLDVSDRADPVLLYETSIQGTLESTRAIGDFVYVIASTYNSMQLPTPITVCAAENEGCFYETKQQFVARVEDNILDEALLGVETHDASGDLVDTHSLLDLSHLLELTESNSLSFSAVLTFDVTSDELGPTASTMFSHGTTSEIYVSTEAIYVLEQTFNGNTQTNVHKLSLGEDGDVGWVASGSVDGRVLNQFSVDEYDGYLRIATTLDRWSGGSSLYVLQQTGTQLDVIGSVQGLAPGEKIYSARFDGQRAFIVTYRKTDPLFVFDLSDPTSPEVLGQLKISGYSNYLQLIDENLLLGIGREANGGGLFQEIQVSLFDISDFDNPTILHRYSFEGGRNLWSPIMADAWNLGTHHSVSYFAGSQVLILPTYEGDGSSWPWARNGATANVSMQVLSIDVDAGISLLGQVDMGNPFDPHQARSVRIDDVLFSISPEKIKANELLNPANELSELLLDAPIAIASKLNSDRRTNRIDAAHANLRIDVADTVFRRISLRANRRTHVTRTEIRTANRQLADITSKQRDISATDTSGLPTGRSPLVGSLRARRGNSRMSSSVQEGAPDIL